MFYTERWEDSYDLPSGSGYDEPSAAPVLAFCLVHMYVTTPIRTMDMTPATMIQVITTASEVLLILSLMVSSSMEMPAVLSNT